MYTELNGLKICRADYNEKYRNNLNFYAEVGYNIIGGADIKAG